MAGIACQSRILPRQGIAVSDLSRLQLFQRGQELPLLVRGDSTIEFYGLRNYGDSTYYDFYTDTSSYWLTLGNRDGQRYIHSLQSWPGEWNRLALFPGDYSRGEEHGLL